jgi:hypothetical protein
MAKKIFRWKAIVPVVLFLALVTILWIIFADRILRSQIESIGSSTLGTELDLASFQLRERDAAMDMGGLQIANPSDPKKNLIEAETITADLVALPAAEKKVVIERLTLSGLRFGTTREHPARPAPKDSPSRKLWEQTQDWVKQNFALPKIAMQRVDTVKSLVLDPTQLGTVKAAEALAAKADSTRQALTQTLQSIQVKPVVDSATALANRLAKTDPGKLGVTGVASAVSDVKRNIDQIEQTEKQLQDLEKNVNSSLTVLNQGLKDVDEARQRDYAFAKGLLNLPLVSAPEISQALFGQPSLDYFQKALYYAQLAQRYLPPDCDRSIGRVPGVSAWRAPRWIFPGNTSIPSSFSSGATSISPSARILPGDNSRLRLPVLPPNRHSTASLRLSSQAGRSPSPHRSWSR